MELIQIQTATADRQSYNRNAQSILDKIVGKQADVQLIDTLLDYANTIFPINEFPIKKFLVLRLIKDGIVLKSSKLINRYLSNRALNQKIGQFCTHKIGDHDANRGADLFDTDPEVGSQFLRLCLELVQFLAKTYPLDSKKAPTKFKIQFDELQQMGVIFPPQSDLMDPFNPKQQGQPQIQPQLQPQFQQQNFQNNAERDQVMLELNTMKKNLYTDIEMINDTVAEEGGDMEYINDVLETYKDSMVQISKGFSKQIQRAQQFEGVLNDDELSELLSLEDFVKRYPKFYQAYLAEGCTLEAYQIIRVQVLELIQKIQSKDFTVTPQPQVSHHQLTKQEKRVGARSQVQQQQLFQFQDDDELINQIKQQSLITEQQRIEKQKLEESKIQIDKSQEIKQQEKIKLEQIRQDQLRQEAIRQEEIRQEQIRQEKIRQEQYRLEQQRQEEIRQEQFRQEQLREDKIRQEILRQQEEEQKQQIWKQQQQQQQQYQQQQQQQYQQQQQQNQYQQSQPMKSQQFLQQQQSGFNNQQSQFNNQFDQQQQKSNIYQSNNQFEENFQENFDGLSVSSQGESNYPLRMDQQIQIKNYIGTPVRFNSQQFDLLDQYRLNDQQKKRFKIATLTHKAALINSQQLQIGVKTNLQYVSLREKNYLKINLFFGNKTQFPITNCKVVYEGDNKSFSMWIQPNQLESVIEPGSQLKQEIICIYKNGNYRLANLQFYGEWKNSKLQTTCFLPCTLAQFIDFKDISTQIFRMKWRGKKQDILKGETFLLNSRIMKTGYHLKKYFPKLCEFCPFSHFQEQQLDMISNPDQQQRKYISYKLGGIFELTNVNQNYMVKFIVLPNMQCTIQIITSNQMIGKELLNTFTWLIGVP